MHALERQTKSTDLGYCFTKLNHFGFWTEDWQLQGKAQWPSSNPFTLLATLKNY